MDLRTSDKQGPHRLATGNRTWERLSRGELSWDTFRARAAILAKIREFFASRGFLEVDPPIAAPWPNIDPNVFPVTVSDAAARPSRLFLHTSPELSMKKLLAAGSGDIFFLGKVFRDREGSPLHAPEFTMLEWYRVGAGAGDVMADVEELVRTLALAQRGRPEIARDGRRIPLAAAWARRELRDVFAAIVGAAPDDEVGLRASLLSRGFRIGADESWEDLFFRAYVDLVEPSLAAAGACFLRGFPAPLAAMAKRRAQDGKTAERFEGYLDGVEIVNGYEELTDAAEQEERLRELAARHAERTGEVLPVDPEFLEALRRGMPACSGAALGVDRLVMLLAGRDTIHDVTYR